MNRMSWIMCLSVLCSLVGCVVPIVVPTGSSPAASAGDSNAIPRTSQELAVLAQVNAFRAGQGRSALAFSPVLTQVAQAHSDDMARRGVLSHQGANGSSVGDRARSAGYGWCRIAENIAQGQKDLAQAMDAWKRSAAHRDNLLNRGLRDVGLGQNGDYWTLVLGAPGC